MRLLLIVITVLTLSVNVLHAQQIDFTDATIIVSSKIKSPVRETVLEILKQEVGKRTSIEFQQGKSWKGDNKSIIAVA